MTDSATPPPPNDRASLFEALPGLARIGAGVWWRTAGWTLERSMQAGNRILRAATAGESVTSLLTDAGSELRHYVRRALDIVDPGSAQPEPEVDPFPATAAAAEGGQPASTNTLRARGEELLRRSADIRYQEDAHPAYDRILGELAPDEGRVLRLLALEGAQPAVDVRVSRTVIASTQLIAPGLSMIGAQAGARYLDRVPAYLNNLYRLGLIWFSREPLEDPLRYQVLEAQPEVLEAMRRRGRSKTVRRSILLTPFGADFANVCLPLHTAELDMLPGDGLTPPGQPLA